MSFKRSLLSSAMMFAMAAPGLALSEIEVNGYIKNESAFFVSDGQTIGQATSTIDTTSNHNGGDGMKMENSARLFFNGDLGEESSWHGEVNIVHDAQAVNKDYKAHSRFSQNDFLRELYIDTRVGDIDLRLGKQQVVWGTADGIKLLDIINPTDYRELVQNSMEESRIPIWMLNAEMDVGNTGNLQFIVSQVEENKIPGLNANGDSGQVFVAKGVDTITGKVNGFLNIAPALANVANSFHNFATAGSFTGGAGNPLGLTPFGGLTVDGFAAQNWNITFAAGSPLPLLAPTGAPTGVVAESAANPLLAGPGTYSGNTLLNTFANDDASVGSNSNSYVTNLTNVSGSNGSASTVTWNPKNASSAFEYMSMATFATFNTFAGNLGTGGTTPSVTTEYVVDNSARNDANSGFRFKNSTDSGFNYSLNYFYHYDTNPSVNLSWHDAVTGDRLTTELASNGFFVDPLGNPAGYFADPNSNGNAPGAAVGQVITANQVPTSFVPDVAGNATNAVTVLLKDAAGGYYGAVNPNPMDPTVVSSANAANGTTLRFTEKLNRVHSIGGAFDYAFDTSFSPVVLRAEFLYNQNELMPVVDKRLLAIGDLENSLSMVESDTFKYVLGVDITVLTNMLISTQFIQMRNLDFVDESRTCTTQLGTTFDCSKYTGDMFTLSLTNGMNKAEKNKEFVSIFFSKPFGESQEHRWNNILMFEENGGFWNRFDVEYSFSDDLIGSAELNMYWGDEDTQFGQFKESSNVQFGIKYLFE